MLRISDVFYNAVFGDKNEEDATKKSDISYSVFEDLDKDVEKGRDSDFSKSHDKEVFNSRNKLSIRSQD